jgi:glycosyltransferase involved in cell wall biosynthesis
MPVAVLIPTYGRASRIPEVTTNVLESTEHANVYFICEADDQQSIETVTFTVGANLIINTRTRNYAGAINEGVHATDEPYVFAGADDLNFHAGWYEYASAAMKYPIRVVGTNDLYNPDVLAGSHATHYLVDRFYATRGCIDAPGMMLCEKYHHNWCDTEFIALAQKRNVYASCLSAVVEHRHWAWGKATIDATYDKGLRHEPDDRALFHQRKSLWTTQ